MLCSACTIAFTGSDRPWYYVQDRKSSIPAYFHHASPAGLSKAAQNGCHICAVIWKKLSKQEQEVLLNTWSNSYLHRFSQGLQALWTKPLAFYSWSPVWFSKEDFSICFQFGDNPAWKKITFRIMPAVEQEVDEPDPVDHDLVSPVSPRDALKTREWSRNVTIETYSMWTPRIRRLLQRWYTACTECHETCRSGYNLPHAIDTPRHTFQPTRILDVTDGKIRLDCAPGDRRGHRYASLTHRWSIYPETMPRLNADVLAQWEHNIDPSILTKTFQDAIEVTRRSQLRFLWIDSLCILQTGPGWEEDWQKEAARMGEVYRHAFLNIQAGRDTDDGPYGLFKTPKNRRIEPFRIKIDRELIRPAPRSSSRSHTTVQVKGDFFIVEEDFARDELIGNPINRRGWVLQERLLSHRIVHFGPEQVFWECRQLLACETFPDGLPRNIPQTLARAATQLVRSPTMFEPKSLTRSLTRRLTNKLTLPKTAKRVPLPSFPHLTCHQDLLGWFYLAELYSACSLTRHTDKLVAISGLAQMFALSSSYLTHNQADVVDYLRTLALPRAGPHSHSTTNPYLAHTTTTTDTSTPTISRPPTDYLAGLWKYDLIPCLLWHVANGRQVSGAPSQRITTNTTSSPRPRSHDASSLLTPDSHAYAHTPSWSWASLNGLINASIYQTWPTRVDGVLLAEISCASTTPLYPNHPWGQVRRGEIHLTGKLVREKHALWPSADEIEAGRGRLSVHASEVKVRLRRRFLRNSASVNRWRVVEAVVGCLVDDLVEFVERLRRSGRGRGGGYEVALLPLVGLQRRVGSWEGVEGWRDEVFEWHGLVVGVRGLDDGGGGGGGGIGVGQGEVVAERLGYFRCVDTKVFGAVLDREGEKDLVLV